MSVTLVQRYDPEWPRQFLTLHAFLGRNLAGTYHAIEHVGSTAVPGMVARPVIDVDVVVREGALERVKTYLEAIGYEHEGDKGIAGVEAFRLADAGLAGALPRHCLYALEADTEELRRHLAFRDHMRAHPGDAERLSNLKWHLAERFDNDLEAYMDGKAALVHEILQAALQQAPA